MYDGGKHEWADLQFHQTKVTLAKAALAGVTYDPIYDIIYGRHGPAVKSPDDRVTTKYFAVLPDGTRSEYAFEDELAAAIWALTLLDPQTPARPIEGFLLKPENEQ